MAREAEFLALPWAIFFLALPIAAIEAALGIITLLIYLAVSYMIGPVIQFDGQTEYSLGQVMFRFLKGVTA